MWKLSHQEISVSPVPYILVNGREILLNFHLLNPCYLSNSAYLHAQYPESNWGNFKWIRFCIGKTQNVLFTIHIEHASLLTFLVAKCVWGGGFPTISNPVWHQLGVLHVNSVYLQVNTVTSHRLRVQSHKTFPHFRCKPQMIGPQVTV